MDQLRLRHRQLRRHHQGIRPGTEAADPHRRLQADHQQTTGTGGSFTVYTNSSASLSGAVEVGKGTFEGKDAVVTLDTSKQSAEKGAYVIIVVNELPRLSMPIGNWSYGLRINEIKVD